MANGTYDAIVVGAGPGGSTCAALLAKQGMKVLMVEKNDRAGGKALTVSREGFRYELWPVSGGPQRNSQFEAVLKELELDTDILLPSAGTSMLYRDSSGNYGLPQRDATPDPEETAGTASFYTDMASLTPEQIDDLDDVSFHDFLSRYKIPKSMYSSMAAMQANIIFVVPVDRLAASEAIKVMRDFATGGAACYFKGGYGRLFEVFTEAFTRYGGEVQLRTKVARIIVEDGQVRGVDTEHGTFHAPIVVSNAGIQPTVLKLVGEGHFDKDYVKYVKDLVPSVALMGVRYFLNKPLLDKSLYVTFSDDNYCNAERLMKAAKGEIPEEVMLFIVVPSVFDPSLAPEGKQCALVSTWCPPGADLKNPEMYWERVDKTMAKIWPELPQCTEHKEYYSTADVSSVTRDHVLPGQGGECIGLGQTVGQCGRHKPSAEAPVKGLFYVGCDAGGYGCGTHQGIDSGVNVSRMVLEYHKTP